MRSTSDEAINSKSEDLDDDSLRSPYYKQRPHRGGSHHPHGMAPSASSTGVSLRYPLSPQSPSDESSYQGSIPGSGPSDRSYNGGQGGNMLGGLSTDSTRSAEEDPMLRTGFFLPEYKH